MLTAVVEDLNVSSPSRRRRAEIAQRGTTTVELSMSAFSDDPVERIGLTTLNAKLFVLDDKTEEQFEVGYIRGYRAPIYSDLRTLRDLADDIAPDVHYAFSWLLREFSEDDDYIIEKTIFLIDRVNLEKDWRGMNLALPATATFLDLVNAHESLVFCQAARPNHGQFRPKAQKRRSLALQRYWAKLGLDELDSESEMCWTYSWECPENLRARL